MSRTHLSLAFGIVAALMLAAGCNKKSEPTKESGAGPDPKQTPLQPLTGEALAAAKAEAVNRLTQLGLALHKYEADHGQFPAGIVGPENQLGLSWRVQLLPYLGDAEAKLFTEFKQDEAWNSPHNKALLVRMPKVFESTGTPADPGETYLLSFTGDQAFVPPLFKETKGKGAPPAKFAPGTVAAGRKITDISDGTHNTFMVVECDSPTQWTKPEDMAFGRTGGKPALVPPLAGVFKGGFHGLMCDGSVHYFPNTPNTLPRKEIMKLITTNGGEVLSEEAMKILYPEMPKDGKSKEGVPVAPPPKSSEGNPVKKK